jgi:hypothetical protein
MYELSSHKLCKENNTIQQILHSSGFETSVTKSKQSNKKLGKEKSQWAKFSYVGKETRAVTKAFRNTNLKIAYSTNSAIGKILTIRHRKRKYEECGVYQLTCSTCNKIYIGQTGHALKSVFTNNSETRNKEMVNPVSLNT